MRKQKKLEAERAAEAAKFQKQQGKLKESKWLVRQKQKQIRQKGLAVGEAG